MVELDDERYAKLKKDADDNKQIVRIVYGVIGLLIFIILFFTWLKPVLDLDIQKRNIDLQKYELIQMSQSKKQAMLIESEGLTFDEYCKWLEVSK